MSMTAEDYALRCETIAFLMLKRIEVREDLIRRLGSKPCTEFGTIEVQMPDGSTKMIVVPYPALFQEAHNLDKRIMDELRQLTDT